MTSYPGQTRTNCAPPYGTPNHRCVTREPEWRTVLATPGLWVKFLHGPCIQNICVTCWPLWIKECLLNDHIPNLFNQTLKEKFMTYFAQVLCWRFFVGLKNCSECERALLKGSATFFQFKSKMTYPNLTACSSGPEARICIFLVPFERKHLKFVKMWRECGKI